MKALDYAKLAVLIASTSISNLPRLEYGGPSYKGINHKAKNRYGKRKKSRKRR